MSREIYQSRRGGGLGDDGIDWAEIISAGTAGAAGIIKATKQPSYPYAGMPGVNPMTGQFYPTQSSGGLGVNLNSTTLILLVGVGAMVMMKR